MGLQQAHAQTHKPAFVSVEAHASLFNDASDRSLLGNTFGYGFKGGYRWDNGWGMFGQVEHNLWLASEDALATVNGALNLGLGFEVLFFGDRVRAGLAVGPSILLFDTVIEETGEVGFFLDARVAGLRWPAGDSVVIVLDPLSFAFVAPVLGSIPLVLVEYRTVLSIEGIW